MTGEQLKKWRESQSPVYEKDERGIQIDHMSQEEAAEHFGVTRQTINNWENNHTPIPKAVEIVVNG